MEDERKAVLKLLNSSTFRTLINSQVDKLLKDNQQAELLRKTGNDFYKKAVHSFNSHNGAWQYYSMSIARAESNSEGLAMSYGNRSAILLHFSKYEASVRDINRALSITKNDNLKLKLLLRKAKCLHMMGSKYYQSILKEADLLLDEITSLKNTFQAEVDKVKLILNKPATPYAPPKNKYTEVVKKLHKKHKLGDFSLLEMQCNEKYGRHLVAAKDIRPGDAIYIEKPYVQFPNLLKMHAYCAHCFATVWDNIPCNHCCWAMFCSEKCKKEAWEEYHKIECPVYGDCKLDIKDSFRQLTLRIISCALIKYGSIEKLKAELATFEDGNKDYKKGFMRNGKLQSNGLKSVYFLCKNVPASTLDNHMKNTAWILRSFGKNTSFFGKSFDYTNVESYKNNEDVIFLGSLFLRLSKISQLNAFQILNRSHMCPNIIESDCLKRDCCTGGTFIAPISGLLSHDCFPNANICYTSERTVLLYALQPIKKGAQIFTSYLKLFKEDDVGNRRKELRDRYNFSCDCFSCERKLETGMDFKHGLPDMRDMIRKMDAVDRYVAVEYHDMMNIGIDENIRCDEATIIHFRKGLELAFVPTRSERLRSSGNTCLMGAMLCAFDIIYGIKLDVPEHCNNI